MRPYEMRSRPRSNAPLLRGTRGVVATGPHQVCEDVMVGGVPCRVCEVGRVVEEGVGMGEEGGEVGCEVVTEAGLVEWWGERRGEGETG